MTDFAEGLAAVDRAAAALERIAGVLAEQAGLLRALAHGLKGAAPEAGRERGPRA